MILRFYLRLAQAGQPWRWLALLVLALSLALGLFSLLYPPLDPAQPWVWIASLLLFWWSSLVSLFQHPFLQQSTPSTRWARIKHRFKRGLWQVAAWLHLALGAVVMWLSLRLLLLALQQGHA
ncbi:hypothetical protein [Marinospirillum sp.]|uniref:hypothetical protein n=1 Tax=Marinospirillum sp. TaxID=2183934 RepID=UPI003A870ACD